MLKRDEITKYINDNAKWIIWEKSCNHTANMFFDLYFEKVVPENIKSIIYNASKLNINLKDCIWIPISSKMNNEISLSRINKAIKILSKYSKKKLILLGDIPIDKFGQDNPLKMTFDMFSYYNLLKRYPWFRYLSYSDCLNKENIKSLYTENDPFFGDKIFEVENLLADKQALKKMINYCMDQLSKFHEFSF